MAGNNVGFQELEVDAKASIHPQLIGKIISDSVLDSVEVISSIRHMWELYYEFNFHIAHLGDNLYLFTFKDVASAMEVFEDGPWEVEGHFLCLRQRRTHMNLEKVRFTHLAMWVQIHGLMWDQTTEKNAKVIGSEIGLLLKVDKQSLNDVLKLGFIRIQVLLDCSKALKPNMWVKRPDAIKYKIDFKYENPNIFCYNCGRLGHLQYECTDRDHPQRQSFGLWLEAYHCPKNKHKGKSRKRFQNHEFYDVVVDITDTENKDDWSNVTNKLLRRMGVSEGKRCSGRVMVLISAVPLLVMMMFVLYSMFEN